jgi:hypothetical protein
VSEQTPGDAPEALSAPDAPPAEPPADAPLGSTPDIAFAAEPPASSHATRRSLKPVPLAARTADESAFHEDRLRALVVGAVVVLVVGVVLLVASFSVIDGALSGLGAGSWSPLNSTGVVESGMRSVWWADGGAYLVAQVIDASGAPQAVIWSRATGKTRIIKGVQVVGVEPYSPRAWIVTGATPAELAKRYQDSPMLPAEGYDLPSNSAEVLDLSATGTPVPAPAPPAWAPWPGPGGVSAILGVEPTHGVMPSVLAFRAAGGQLTTATPVPGGRSFMPLGFSPSGRYFAYKPLARWSKDAWVDDTETLGVQIVSVQTGRVVASMSTTSSDSVGSVGDIHSSWDASSDVLYFDDVAPMTDVNDENANESPMIRYLAANGATGDAAKAFHWKMPSGVSSSFEARLIGETTAGPLWSLEGERGTEVYRLTPSGPVSTPQSNGELLIGLPIATDPAGNVAVLGEMNDDGTLQLTIVKADGSTSVVWDDGRKRAQE